MPIVNRDIDGGWGWLVVVAAHCSRAFSRAIHYSSGPFIVEWLEHFDQSAAVISWVFSLASLVTSIVSLFIGEATVKFGIRPIVILGGVFLFIGFFFSAFAQRIEHLFISLGVIVGAGIGMINAPSLLIVGDYFKRRLNFAHGLVMVGSCTGQLVFVTLFTYLNSTYGWRGTTLIFAAISANVVACGAIFRPPKGPSEDCSVQAKVVKDVARKNGTNPSFGDTYSTEDVSINDQQKIAALHLDIQKRLCDTFALNVCLKNSMLGWYQICVCCQGAAGFALLSHLVNKAVVSGKSKENATMLMTIVAIGNILSRASHGWFIDKGFVSAQTLFLSASLFCAVETMTFIFINTYSTLALLSFFFGFHLGILAGLTFFLPRLLVTSEQVPSAIGFTSVVCSIGNVIGPVLAGLLYDVTGNYMASFCFAAGLYGLAAVLFVPVYWFLWKQSRKTIEAAV